MNYFSFDKVIHFLSQTYIILLFLTLEINAQQIKEFNTEHSVFEKQVLQLILTSSSDKKLAKSYTKNFNILWNNSQLNDNNKNEIIIIANIFLKQRARFNPYFKNFFNLILEFKNSNQSELNFNNWLKGLDEYAHRDNNTLQNIHLFIKATYQLLTENKIFSSNYVNWKTNNTNFEFVFTDQLYIYFESLTLTALAKRDSIKIVDTQGRYNPFTHKWKGTKGTVYWDRAGFNNHQVYTNFTNYTIAMTKAFYKVDTATTINKIYTSSKVKGSFEDKVMFIKNKKSATYPKFQSFSKRIRIKQFYEDVDYEGGFTMSGAKFIGAGTEEIPARLMIYRNDTLFMLVESSYIALRKESASIQKAYCEIYLDNNTLTQDNLKFNFNVKRKNVSLVNNMENEYGSMPLSDKYHATLLRFTNLVWNKKADEIYLGTKSNTISKLSIESLNYFSEELYDKLQRTDDKNPLILLKEFSEFKNSSGFYVKDYADYIKKPLAQAVKQLLDLSFIGILYYDEKTRYVELSNRFYKYLDFHFKKKDYDLISLSSNTQKRYNAILDLKNFEMYVKGIAPFQLSQIKNVFIIPKRGNITLKKNLDIDVTGDIQTGLFRFRGKEHHFIYDDFKINITKADSLLILITTEVKDKFNEFERRPINSIIHQTTGNIKIDKYDNKSGTKEYPEYPIFTSTTNSFVYYNVNDSMKKYYPKDTFYFEIFPYTLDSLNDLNKKYLNFKGQLISGGIFPIFKETVKIQEDLSLGFVKKTSNNGIDMYGGKGIFSNTIVLNNKGLSGSGKLKYLSSISYADDFKFKLDKTTALTKKFVINEKGTATAYPRTTGINIDIEWRPNEDLLISKSTDSNFVINTAGYDGDFSGSLSLSPKNLKGKGFYQYDILKLRSQSFNFQNQRFTTDTSQLSFLSDDHSKDFFQADNVRAEVNFKDRIGRFRFNKDSTMIKFPENKYIAYLKSFMWDMDKNKLYTGLVDVNKRGIENVEKATLISVHKDQDSLRFSAIAEFDLGSGIINASHVDDFTIANGAVMIKDRKLTIKQNAAIDPIKDVTIIADTLRKYHKVYNATANILGKYNMNAEGKYDFVDNEKNVYTIDMRLSVDENSREIDGNGRVSEEDSLRFDKNFAFQGKLRLTTTQKILYYDGYVKPNFYNSKYIKNYWIYFEKKINPSNVQIPIGEDLKDDNDEPLFTSLFATNESPRIYPAFCSKRANYSDSVIIGSKGYLMFNEKEKAYWVAASSKLKNINTIGNLIKFYPLDNKIYAEGKISLGVNLGNVKLSGTGMINYDLKNEKFEMDLLLMSDFYFDKNLLKMMTSDIIGELPIDSSEMQKDTKKIAKKPSKEKTPQQIIDVPKLEDIKGDKRLQKKLMEVVGKDMSSKLIFNIQKKSEKISLPDELKKTITFNDLQLVWDKDERIFYSVGKIGIGSIANIPINKYTDGYVEIIKKRSGSKLTIYIEIDKGKWYFFSYQYNNMSALSYNKEFNEIIKNTPAVKRKLKVAPNESPYIYILSSSSNYNKFMGRYQQRKSE